MRSLVTYMSRPIYSLSLGGTLGISVIENAKLWLLQCSCRLFRRMTTDKHRNITSTVFYENILRESERESERRATKRRATETRAYLHRMLFMEGMATPSARPMRARMRSSIPMEWPAAQGVASVASDHKAAPQAITTLPPYRSASRPPGIGEIR